MDSKNTERRIIRRPEYQRISGLSRTQLWRLERAGRLPCRLKLGPNSCGWWLDEVLAALEKLPRVPSAPKAAA